MYFGTKNYLKSTRNHTAKHAENAVNRHHPDVEWRQVFEPINFFLLLFLCSITNYSITPS
jgi:hypothetical protein